MISLYNQYPSYSNFREQAEFGLDFVVQKRNYQARLWQIVCKFDLVWWAYIRTFIQLRWGHPYSGDIFKLILALIIFLFKVPWNLPLVWRYTGIYTSMPNLHVVHIFLNLELILQQVRLSYDLYNSILEHG